MVDLREKELLIHRVGYVVVKIPLVIVKARVTDRLVVDFESIPFSERKNVMFYLRKSLEDVDWSRLFGTEVEGRIEDVGRRNVYLGLVFFESDAPSSDARIINVVKSVCKRGNDEFLSEVEIRYDDGEVGYIQYNIDGWFEVIRPYGKE